MPSSDEEYFELVTKCLEESNGARILSRELKEKNTVWLVTFKDVVYTVVGGRNLSGLKYEQPSVIISWNDTPFPFLMPCGEGITYFDLRFHLRSRNLEGLGQALCGRLIASGIGLISFHDFRRHAGPTEVLASAAGRVASYLRRNRRGRRPSEMIIFVGPIASGKTTQRMMLFRYMSDSQRVFTLTFPPFAFLSHSIAGTVARFVSLPRIRTLSNADLNEDSLDLLADYAPAALQKIIGQLALMDLVQVVAFLFSARILRSLGFSILIEDFLPAIKLDHDLFFNLYQDHTKSSGITGLYNYLGHLTERISPMRPVCVILQATANTRHARSVGRAYRIVDVASTHDQNRELNLEKVSRSLFEECIVIDTDNLSREEVFESLLYHLRFHDAID
ncbi:MAG: hypothetical protein JRN52_01825 [Nitrososphaerota archaeon]|nr:hypothetical protein [Nitrososphaerota archaeon]